MVENTRKDCSSSSSSWDRNFHWAHKWLVTRAFFFPPLFSSERTPIDYFPKWAFVRTNDREIDWKNDWVACRTELSDPSSGTNEITAVSKINTFLGRGGMIKKRQRFLLASTRISMLDKLLGFHSSISVTNQLKNRLRWYFRAFATIESRTVMDIQRNISSLVLYWLPINAATADPSAWIIVSLHLL